MNDNEEKVEVETNNEVENEEQEVLDEVQESQTEELRKINDELKDKLQRSLAEFDNFRKRTVKEKASMYDDGVRDTVEKLLPILDNFERALGSVEDKNNNIYKGIEMLLRQFQNILTEIGVEPIESVGEKFDTNKHFAVAHVEDEKASENEVIEELQKGYKYKDKVIRTSMVKVAN